MDHRKNGDRRLLLWYFAVAIAVKLLLTQSYGNTDFEVHRNWLAITHSLPLSKWYFDDTSSWTLDYPPFFAYFESFLSIFARLVDPKIVDLHSSLDYSAESVIYFQRISVIVSDLCLLFGVYILTRKLEPMKRNLICALVIWSPGLLIVDHIHFQYNGFLLGLLLLSISFPQEVSCYSLFPFLNEPQEYPIKVLLLLLHSMVMWLGFAAQYADEKALKKETGEIKSKFKIGCFGKSYLMGLVIVEMVSQFLHPYFLGDKFAFMPLMLISTCCAVGVMYSWIWQLRRILT